ncbi:Bug family tripartite tricarboxylate transporter substrate binding protein [Paracraurococcus lichenis]|uniref:Tripartite tricarboxylate transporter substrate binding protein n=1 Tax=Paracraurococcus lichenis TaxID=3064888 RepID=A0ABT9DSP9_9PROT|nr:tripartite tricarboxylate transporter substrate binding protein [Paracraurococcus sp. LOR1-02]MDO9706925.1 tripartite tricarboxylate transporter substrate binding protein [Paracraurococcus sp. LOR1-02]
MRIGRRAVLGTMLAAPALAQPEFPARPVRLVVGYPPGGSTDLVARLLAERLSRAWGQPVVVENRPGAAGTLGADLVAKAAPDGYTLLVGASGEMAVARAVMRSIPYQPADFAPIAWLTEQPFLVLVHAGLPARSLGDLVALARERNGRLDYASHGNGTANHLLAELLKVETGVAITHIPYRGGGPAMTDLVSGNVPMLLDVIPSAMPHLASGRVRALALCRATRSAVLPEVPTTAEAGFPFLTGSTWATLVAPARMPESVLARIGDAVQAAMRDGLAEAFRERGLEPVGADAAAARAFIAAEQAKWVQMAQRAGVQPE